MTLAYIPSPTISQFSIGPVTIHFYALCILLGGMDDNRSLETIWR